MFPNEYIANNPPKRRFLEEGPWELLGPGGQNDSSDMNDDSALIKESPALPSPFLPCEDPVRQLCTDQEASPYQTVYLLVP